MESIVRRENMFPEEVVTIAKMESADREENVILAGRGLFNDPQDALALTAAVELAYQDRKRPDRNFDDFQI